MAARKPPESWFWSHDIDPRYIEDVLLPGTHLMRLSVYGSGKLRRFASISYREPGTESNYVLDVPAAQLASKVQEAGIRPVSITADVSTGQALFSLVLQKGPGVLTSVHHDLDAHGLAKLIDDQHVIADLATYTVDARAGTPHSSRSARTRAGCSPASTPPSSTSRCSSTAPR